MGKGQMPHAGGRRQRALLIPGGCAALASWAVSMSALGIIFSFV